MLQYALIFVTGVLVKLADLKQHVLLGLAYGLSAGLALPFAATVFIPIVLANFAAGKIDSFVHLAALIPFTALLLFFSPSLLPIALLFLAAAYLDEASNLPLRPFLPAAALLVGLVLNEFSYLVIVLVFDAGYLLAEFFFKQGFLASTEVPD